MSEFSLFLTPKILSQLDINSGPLSLYLSLSLSHTHTHSNHFTLHAFVFYFSLSLSLTLTHVPLCFICSFYLYRLKRIKTNGYYKSARLSKLRIKSFSLVHGQAFVAKLSRPVSGSDKRKKWLLSGKGSPRPINLIKEFDLSKVFSSRPF